MSSIVHESTYFPKLLCFDLKEVFKTLGYIHYITALQEQIHNTVFFNLFSRTKRKLSNRNKTVIDAPYHDGVGNQCIYKQPLCSPCSADKHDASTCTGCRSGEMTEFDGEKYSRSSMEVKTLQHQSAQQLSQEEHLLYSSLCKTS